MTDDKFMIENIQYNFTTRTVYGDLRGGGGELPQGGSVTNARELPV